jgi:mono/diheme cytochrome c family protein
MIHSSRETARRGPCTDGRVWTAAAATLFLLTGCGREVPKSDSGATGGITPDTTTAVVPSPAPTPAPADTGMKADTTKKVEPIAVKPAAKKRVASSGDVAKTAPPTRDTTAAAPKPPSADTAAKQTANADTQQTELRDAYHQPPRDTVTQEVYEGWKQFNLNCARCHGEDAIGTTIAPHLIVSLKPDGPINTQELFISTVCAGRPEKGMPAWCALGLEMDKIQEIYSYVKGRSDGKLAPGRPAVRKEG